MCERAERYAEKFGLESVGEEDGKLILRRWREVIEGLKEDPMSMRHVIDWVAKNELLMACQSDIIFGQLIRD